jgi:hypothetical protein
MSQLDPVSNGCTLSANKQLPSDGRASEGAGPDKGLGSKAQSGS